MKLKNKITILASLIGLASATGCVGGGGEPLNAESTNTIVSNLANNIFAKMPTSANAPSLPMSGISASAVQTKALSCESVSPDPLVDADNDGIAAQKIYTFDCANETSGLNSYTRSGTLKIYDKDDSVAGLAGGLRYEFDLPNFNIETDGSKINNSYSGYWDYTFSGGKLTSTSEFEGSFYYSSDSSDYQSDFTFGYSWDYSLQADDSGNPFTSGSVEFSGTFTMQGKFIIEVNNQHQNYEGSWQIRYYSEDLRYNNTCARWYDSGSIIMTDGSGSIFEIRFSCSTAKFYVNGSESDLYTP